MGFDNDGMRAGCAWVVCSGQMVPHWVVWSWGGGGGGLLGHLAICFTCLRIY